MKPLITSFICATFLGLHSAYAAGGHDDHGAAHADSGGGGLPQFDPSTFSSQVFWLAIAFGVLYLAFSRKTIPDISAVIQNRHEHVQDDLQTAEKLKEEAEAARATYEEALTQARNDATGFFAEAESTLKAAKEASETAFLERSLKEIRSKEKSIKAAQSALMEEIDDVAAEIAKEATEKIIESKTSIASAKSAVQSLVKSQKVKKAA